MLFTRTLGFTFVIASIFLLEPRGINTASVPLFDNIETTDIRDELLPLTTTFKEFNWQGGEVYAAQTFIVYLNEPAQIQVTDYRNRGDHFDVYDNIIWVGRTTNTEFLQDVRGFARTPRHAIGDSHFSQGIFGLAPGTHIITIKATSPYGEGSGAIRLITGVDSMDNLDVDEDYLPSPISHPATENNGIEYGRNGTETQPPVSDSEQENDEMPPANTNSDDDESEDEVNNNGGEFNYGVDNSTISDQEGEVPVSANSTSTTISLPTITKHFKSYSTNVITVVRTVFRDEPSITPSATYQTSISVITGIPQGTVSQVSASEVYVSQTSVSALPSSTIYERDE